MFEKMKFRALLLIAILLTFYIIPFQNVPSYVSFAFSQKKTLNISLTMINQNIKTVAADPANQVLLKVDVMNSMGNPMPKAHVLLDVTGPGGSLSSENIRTDKNGQALITYIPPVADSVNTAASAAPVKITASLSSSTNFAFIEFKLVKNPVVLIHGYNAGGYIFDNMKEALKVQGYDAHAIDYKSQEGVIPSTDTLESYLKELRKTYADNGLQMKKVDLITHSMGGIIARYYTTSPKYLKNNDVRKIIFISVPHRGSLWASVATGYFNDKGINDLVPDNPLLSTTLPSMLNKGMNPNIQIGSIIDQYDEVVSFESASLEQWKIKTEIFNVGENNITMGNLLSGNLILSANHAIILNNKRVFESLLKMLDNPLPYPAIQK